MDNLMKIFEEESRYSMSYLNSLNKIFSDFLTVFPKVDGEVNETENDFEVSIPYSNKDEAIERVIKDGKLIVKVDSYDRSSHYSFSVTIPSNCDTDNLSEKYDEDKGTMLITIPKKSTVKKNRKSQIKEVVDKYESQIKELKAKMKEEINAIKKS